MSNIGSIYIDECCEILDNQRIPLNSEQRNLIPGDIPYYGANGIQGYINDFIFDDNLILIAEDGGNFEQYNTRPIAYKISGKSWVNNHAHILKAKEGINQDYVFYSLQHKDIIKFIKGGTRSKLNQAELKEITIRNPPYNQQKKIAQILTTIDKHIEKTQALIDKHSAIKQGMMADLFTRGIDLTTGQLRPSVEQVPHLYKETELGWIPKDWKEVSLESVASVERGKFTHRPRDDEKCYGGEFPFIQTGNITKSNGHYISEYKQTLSEFGRSVSREFPKDTIAVTIAANIADTAILKIPMCFPDSIVGVIVNNQLATTRYIEITIRLNKQRLDAVAPLSAQKNINLEDLRPLKIKLPSLNEQIELCKRYEAMVSNISSENNSLNKLQLLKKALMQDLLTGKVLVK